MANPKFEGFAVPTAELNITLCNPDISAEVTSSGADVIVPAAPPFRQTGRKYMSKRSGQTGTVKLRNDRWIGRYYVDVFGQSKRVRLAVVLGMKRELTKSAAKLKLLGIITEAGVNTPSHLERSLKPPVTFADVADAWEGKRLPLLKISTQYAAPQQIAKHLRPFFGALPLETIKTGTVNDWIAGLVKKGLEPKTVHNQWKQFRAIMNWHAQQNDVPKRTWYPTLPDILDVEQRWYTQDEIRRIISAAKGQYKPLFHLTAFSGLRSGEISGLHVEDLDLVRGVVHVRRSVWQGIEVVTKGKKRRDVFIDSNTTGMLKEYLGGRTTGRVFQTRNGTPLNNQNIVNKVLGPICKRLGIKHGGMHAFRHGRVSDLQANNVPADFIRRQVGHSSLRTTSGYTHFSEAFIRETVERVAAVGLTA
jgi:integrase